MTLCVLIATLSTVLTGCRKESMAEYRFRYANEQPVGALRSQSMLFFEEELERVNGLRNMRERAREVDAALELDTAEGKGTSLRFRKSF